MMGMDKATKSYLDEGFHLTFHMATNVGTYIIAN